MGLFQDCPFPGEVVTETLQLQPMTGDTTPKNHIPLQKDIPRIDKGHKNH